MKRVSCIATVDWSTVPAAGLRIQVGPDYVGPESSLGSPKYGANLRGRSHGIGADPDLNLSCRQIKKLMTLHIQH